jgi:hypothetical protein
LVWQADTKISASAFLVNSVEQWREEKVGTWIVLFYKYIQSVKGCVRSCNGFSL